MHPTLLTPKISAPKFLICTPEVLTRELDPIPYVLGLCVVYMLPSMTDIDLHCQKMFGKIRHLEQEIFANYELRETKLCKCPLHTTIQVQSNVTQR